MALNLVSFVYTSLTFLLVDAFPNGAPTGVCETMTPGHGLEQRSGNQYSLDTGGVTEYTPGRPVTVIVRGVSFQGLLIQVRRIGSDQILGHFKTPGENLKLLTCGGIEGSSVTHANTRDKLNTVLEWIPPASDQGQLEFIATVAQSKTMWWKNTKSVTLTFKPAPSGGNNPAAPGDNPPPPPQEPGEPRTTTEDPSNRGGTNAGSGQFSYLVLSVLVFVGAVLFVT